MITRTNHGTPIPVGEYTKKSLTESFWEEYQTKCQALGCPSEVGETRTIEILGRPCKVVGYFSNGGPSIPKHWTWDFNRGIQGGCWDVNKQPFEF